MLGSTFMRTHRHKQPKASSRLQVITFFKSSTKKEEHRTKEGKMVIRSIYRIRQNEKKKSNFRRSTRSNRHSRCTKHVMTSEWDFIEFYNEMETHNFGHTFTF